MAGLFRAQALARIANPDQLDRVLQVVRPLHVLAVVTLGALVLAGLVWSIMSTAPVTVQASGILLSHEGVADVTAPAAGRVSQLLVAPGDEVTIGQAVAELALPEVADQLRAKRAELIDARAQLAALQATDAEHVTLQDNLMSARRRSVSERIATLDAQRARLVQRRTGEAALREKGFLTASRLTETDTRIAELDDQMATLRNSLVEQRLQRQSDGAQRAQQVREAELRVASVERDLDNRSRDYERNRIVTATATGSVVEFSANVGEFVPAGSSILRVLASDGDAADGLHALLYVSNENGKRVEEGMEAHVMPSTTRAQRDGFIRGTVVKVSKIPATREGMMRRLRNTTLVDQLLRSGAPFEVEVRLLTDPATPSGYLWSSGQGPDTRIDVGTMATASMVVDRTRILSLAMPAFDHVLRWLDVH